MRTRIVSRFAFALCLMASTLSAQSWHQGRVNMFQVTTDAGDMAARDLLVRLQQERALVGQLLHKPKTYVPGLVRVVMVKDASSLTKAVPSFPADAVERGAAAFIGMEHSSIVFVSPSQTESASRALAYLLLSANYPHTPRWFDVGFSRYVGSFQFTREQLEIGRVPSDDKANDSWIPVADLISGGNENDAQWQHEAWLLVHYLITNSRLDEAGKYFYLTMNKQVPPRDALYQAFNEDVQALDRDLHAYDSEVAKHVQRIPAPDTQLFQTFTVDKAPATDVQIAIAAAMLDDHDRSDSAPAAMKLLSGIMHNTPDNPQVQRALAYGYLMQHDSINAVEHARRAIAIQDSDPMMHLIMAAGQNGGDLRVIRSNMAEIRMGADLNAAIRLEPDFAPAYELRGLALMSSDKQDAGLKDLGHAAALRPREDSYLLHLGEAQAATGDWDNAKVLFAAVRNSPDTDVASAASEQLKTGKRLSKEQKHWNEQGIASSTYKDMTDPRWKPTPEMEARNAADGENKVEAGPDTRKVQHLDGELTTIDCSSDPGAILTIHSRGNIWKMKVADRKSVLLIGPDTFSCAWRDKTVSINYKASGGVTGDVVSLEMH